MKKKIAALIAALAAVLILAGCSTREVETEGENSISPKTSRFVLIETTTSWNVVYDKETKVMYAVSNVTHSRGAFTLLVDQNGDPLLYNER